MSHELCRRQFLKAGVGFIAGGSAVMFGDRAVVLAQPTGQQDKYSLWLGATTLRGANLYQRSRIEIYDGEPGDPFVPSYDADIFPQLRSAGANVVFLSIPGPFMVQPPHTVDADAVGLLDDLVNKAEEAGLFVVLAFRTSPGRNENDILNFLPVPVVRSLHHRARICPGGCQVGVLSLPLL